VTEHRAGRIAFAGVVALSLVMLFSPASEVPSGFAFSDKLVHFLLFAALAATGGLAGVRPLPLALGLIAYAGLSEVLQSILPLDRHGDVRDAVADVLGLLTGLGAVVLVSRNRRVGP
jgi:VanZ family protein